MPIEIESPEMMGYDNVRYNLTESSVTDAVLDDLQIDLKETVLAYGDHIGYLPLRETLAAQYGMQPHEIIITAGAAAALFMVHTCLLEDSDRIEVMFPNYGTNLETPLAIGCALDKIELYFEDGWRPDMDEVRKRITPRTQLISITHPHNPTGMCLTREELNGFIQLAEENHCFLLVDETYRELQTGEKLPWAATLSDRVISVASVSKAYGLPGIRIGWVATRNAELQEKLLAAKEQIFICNSLLDEKVAHLYLQKQASFVAQIQKNVAQHFSILKEWIKNEKRMEWVEPQGGVVCFPRIKEKANIDVERFYSTLNTELSTYVGPGHWFGMDKHYMRIGYGWPNADDLKQGLANISKALDLCEM